MLTLLAAKQQSFSPLPGFRTNIFLARSILPDICEGSTIRIVDSTFPTGEEAHGTTLPATARKAP
jgi:hypothetical protein